VRRIVLGRADSENFPAVVDADRKISAETAAANSIS